MSKKEYPQPRLANLHEPTELVDNREVVALEAAFETSWCRETMLPEEQVDFDPTDPSYSQCFVTAMVTAYLLGGEIAQGFIPEDPLSHPAYGRLPGTPE